MMKMAKTATEMTPPVVEVYSVSPLYLMNLLEGKRSTDLKALLAQEKNEGILIFSIIYLLVLLLFLGVYAEKRGVDNEPRMRVRW